MSAYYQLGATLHYAVTKEYRSQEDIENPTNPHKLSAKFYNLIKFLMNPKAAARNLLKIIDNKSHIACFGDIDYEKAVSGDTPIKFAPGIVSTDTYRETEVLFLPDMNELSFTRQGGQYQNPKFVVMEQTNNNWRHKSIPKAKEQAYREKFSPSVDEMKAHDVFKDIPIVGFTKSQNQTYFFYVLDLNDGSGHMSYSRLVNGKYETPIKMSSAINRGKYIAHPYVAPDESYLMWDAEKMDENTPDIYISFKQKDGTWGEAINLGDKINTSAYEQRPKVSPDGKYLFFWRGDRKQKADGTRYWIGDPHWVDAKVIETLKSENS